MLVLTQTRSFVLRLRFVLDRPCPFLLRFRCLLISQPPACPRSLFHGVEFIISAGLGSLLVRRVKGDTKYPWNLVVLNRS